MIGFTLIINETMKNKFAIPVENGVLCSHFGHCTSFAIVEVEGNSIIDTNYVTPPLHEPGILPMWLAENAVNEVIAGGIGQSAVNLLNKQNIVVHIGATAKSPEELVNDRLKNTLITGVNACNH